MIKYIYYANFYCPNCKAYNGKVVVTEKGKLYGEPNRGYCLSCGNKYSDNFKEELIQDSINWQRCNNN